MNGTAITSSVIVSASLGYKPEGVAAKYAGVCCFCGLHIAQGDLCSPFSVSGAFMDDASLAAKGSELTCGHCAPLMTKEELRTSGYGVFTRSGTKPFRKWLEIAEALKNPPDEPFVMAYATANNQHMGWRAPVNFSRELFYVRVGLRDLKVRHATLMKAFEVSQVVGSAFECEATKKTLAHPFLRLSPDLKDISHGKLKIHARPRDRPGEVHQALLAKYQSEIEFLTHLTLGETWGLLFLLTPGAGSESRTSTNTD